MQSVVPESTTDKDGIYTGWSEGVKMEAQLNPDRAEDKIDFTSTLGKLDEIGACKVTHLADNPHDDDENDTLDEPSHSAASAIAEDSTRDESMKTAVMDASKHSSRCFESDSDSFISCSSGRKDASNAAETHIDYDASGLKSITLEMPTNRSEVDNRRSRRCSSDNGGDNDGNGKSGSDDDCSDYSSSSSGGFSSGSEYSESMQFSSFQNQLEQENIARRRSSNKRPPRKGAERAPNGLEIPSPEPNWDISTNKPSKSHTDPHVDNVSRYSSGSGVMRFKPAASMSISRSARTAFKRPTKAMVGGQSRALKSISHSNLGYGEDSLERGWGGRERGRRSGAGRGLAHLRKASFSRSSTDEGPRRPIMRRAATERIVTSAERGEDGRPKFKRRIRSRSMDLGSSHHSPIRRYSHNNRMSVAFGHSREQSSYQPRTIRKGKRMDLQTGGESYRDVLCQRIIDYPEAMNPNERRRKTVMRTGNDAMKNVSMHGDYNVPQYRLQSRVHAQHRFHKEQMQTLAVQPGPLTSYLIWSLRSNFLFVLLSEACAFWVVICIFSICIYVGALYQPECLRFPSNTNFEENGAYFIDAFTLSWTTFSTVGYGVVYPQVRREVHQTSFNCAFMTTLTALEAFVGVLFASFCGAVIVGKMTRAKCTASVSFSQRMIIRFGTGVMHTNDDDDRTDDLGEKPVSEYDKRRLLYPCPVLEFRLANALFENVTGEIMNAKLSVVSSTLAEKKPTETTSLRTSVIGLGGTLGGVRLDALKGGVRPGLDALKGGVRPGLDALKGMTQSASHFLLRPFSETGSDAASTSSTNNLFLAARKVNTSSDLDGNSSHNSFSSFRSMLWSSTGSGRKASSTGDLETKRGRRKEGNSVLRFVSQVGKDAIESVVIKKRLMRTSTVQGRRETNDDSETSRTRAKRTTRVIEEEPTNGLTPRKLFSSLKIETSTHPFFKRVWTIRHVLNADSPLISERARVIIKASKGRWPTEACNHNFIRKNVDFQQLIVSLSGTTTGNKVYGLHVYEYRNLHVGYTFSPILQRTPDGRLAVDLDSIDNIQEQRGGGAEAVDYHDVCGTTCKNQERQPRQGIQRRPAEGPVEMTATASGGGTLHPNPDCMLNMKTHSIEEVDESALSGRLLRSSTVSRSPFDEQDLLLSSRPAKNSVSFEGLPSEESS